jgi:hypothetical protein
VSGQDVSEQQAFLNRALRMQKFSAALLSWPSPRTTSLFIAPHHRAVVYCAGILSKSHANLLNVSISL